MTRKLTIACTLILLVSLFLAAPVSVAKSYYAERFDVHIDLQPDGSAIITETVEFRFSGDPFTFAFREISATETDGITFLEAGMDGVTMPPGTGAGQVEVTAGNPLKVTWHFPPASDAAHVFTVRYRADGVIRKGDADTLIWRAIPQDHDYTIAGSTITLTFPPGAALLEGPSLSRDFETASTEDRILLTSSGLAEDQELILTASFPPHSLTQTAPAWQVRQQQSQAATARALPFGFGAAIATLVLGGLGLFTYARANSRELSLSPVVSNANPPSDVSPALVGRLTAQPHAFMGVVFDLAQRGFLEVREEKGFWGSTSHELVRGEGAAPLQPFEQGLMNALFKPGETRIKMNEVGARLASKKDLFDAPLEHELVQRGWLDLGRKQKKGWLTAVGIVVMLLSFIVGFLAMAGGGFALPGDPAWLVPLAALIGLSVGAFLLSIPLLIYAASFSTLTPAGEEQSIRWKGFAQYLKNVTKGREPAIRPDYFEKYLAYAAVFGLGMGWAKYFQQLGGVPLPLWFHAMAGGRGDFGAMVAVMSASDSAGVSAASGGGAGASGGGASGAG